MGMARDHLPRACAHFLARILPSLAGGFGRFGRSLGTIHQLVHVGVQRFDARSHLVDASGDARRHGVDLLLLQASEHEHDSQPRCDVETRATKRTRGSKRSHVGDIATDVQVMRRSAPGPRDRGTRVRRSILCLRGQERDVSTHQFLQQLSSLVHPRHARPHHPFRVSNLALAEDRCTCVHAPLRARLRDREAQHRSLPPPPPASLLSLPWRSLPPTKARVRLLSPRLRPCGLARTRVDAFPCTPSN